MNGTYYQRGEAIKYTNSGENGISAGDAVSLTTRIGIAGDDIGSGDSGTLHLTGVFELPKDSAAITLGAAVYYDETNDCVTVTETDNIPAGWAVAAAAADDTTCYIKLLG